MKRTFQIFHPTPTPCWQSGQVAAVSMPTMKIRPATSHAIVLALRIKTSLWSNTEQHFQPTSQMKSGTDPKMHLFSVKKLTSCLISGSLPSVLLHHFHFLSLFCPTPTLSTCLGIFAPSPRVSQMHLVCVGLLACREALTVVSFSPLSVARLPIHIGSAS